MESTHRTNRENQVRAKSFTVGYGGRNPKDFIELLTKKGIKTLVDVRLRPDKASMGFYAKAKTPDKGIEKLMDDNGVRYISLIELGNVFLDYEDWQERYTRLIEISGNLLTVRLRSVEEPFCLMCAEKKVSNCHRGLLSNWLLKHGWNEVEHLE